MINLIKQFFKIHIVQTQNGYAVRLFDWSDCKFYYVRKVGLYFQRTETTFTNIKAETSFTLEEATTLAIEYKEDRIRIKNKNKVKLIKFI
jgi:hypothetical protein